ncbi:hypothetical protein NSA40_16455, partial [[Clostridium] innocuum]|nr:hypothetical protein [[Clostridium] innocuum]
RWHATKNEKSLKCLVDADNKLNKTKIANKDLHLIHPDFDITVSQKCCMYLKKKPFEKYNKDTGIKGFITGLRSGEGGGKTVTGRWKNQKWRQLMHDDERQINKQATNHRLDR